MKIRKQQLINIYRIPDSGTVDVMVEYMRMYMPEFRIHDIRRISAFVAQVGHESGRLRYTEEIASGDDYEGREDLGNLQPGDGRRFKGRGLLMITGRYNYERISVDLDEDFVAYPDLLSAPKYAVLSACWYWQKRGLNEIADRDDFRGLTKKINGGYNGYADRLDLYHRALMELEA